MALIFVVDDDAKFRTNLSLDLEDEGYQVRQFPSAEAAGGQLLKQDAAAPDLLLLDVRMQGQSGVSLVEELAAANRLPPTIIVSGEASISETVTALGLGVHDFIEKPFSRQRLRRSIENCMVFQKLRREVASLREGRAGHLPILGEAPCIHQLKAHIAKIAPTNARVLILGESGTGKELVAQSLHTQSPRAKKPFVKINCAALPATLIEAELFGHVRGAFSGAIQDKPGLFEEAHGGSLFLDEIGDMEPALQTRLLRVLEDGRVRRIGARRETAVDVRVIAATNQDLAKRVSQGRFREDLYFRLNTLPLEVPPLRARGNDILLLANYYLHHFCLANQLRPKAFDNEAERALTAYGWPGNVRELRNLCERLAILGRDPAGVADLPSALFAQGARPIETGLVRLPFPHGQMSLKAFKTQCEKEFIESALNLFNWDYVACAKSLGIQRTFLHRKISALGIDKPFRRGGQAASSPAAVERGG